MGKILLSIWDSQANQRVQEVAIERAKNQNDELVFLYVVNIDFLEKTARPVYPRIVKAEMQKLGEFLLSMAEDRSKTKNVPATSILRHGKLRDELKAVALEQNVDQVILGQSLKKRYVSLPANLAAFAQELETELGVETIIIDPDNAEG